MTHTKLLCSQISHCLNILNSTRCCWLLPLWRMKIAWESMIFSSTWNMCYKFMTRGRSTLSQSWVTMRTGTRSLLDRLDQRVLASVAIDTSWYPRISFRSTAILFAKFKSWCKKSLFKSHLRCVGGISIPWLSWAWRLDEAECTMCSLGILSSVT